MDSSLWTVHCFVKNACSCYIPITFPYWILDCLAKFSRFFEITMEKFVDDSIDFYDFAREYDLFHFLKYRVIYNALNEEYF